MPTIASRYYLRLKDQSGVTVAIFDNFASASFTKRVNNIGEFSLRFYDDEDPRFDLFELDGQLEFYRSIPAFGLDFYREFSGLCRSFTRNTDSDGRKFFDVSGFDYNHLLSRRTIAYKHGTILAEKNDYAEDVMKEYVYENCGAGAVSPTRIIEGIFPNFTVQAESADHAQTALWRGDRGFENLLDVLQMIANFTLGTTPAKRAIDFSVEPNGDGAFVFNTYLDQYGSDRTVDTSIAVVFSVELGNLQEVSYTEDRSREATTAVVLGRGERSTQTVIARANTGASDDSPWNSIEIARAADQNEFTYQLEDFGDGLLQENKAREDFSVVPMQVPSTLYGIHYFLGDMVTVRHRVIDRDKKIVAVRVNIQEKQGEAVDVEFSDL
jgi:hypothetical protein